LFCTVRGLTSKMPTDPICRLAPLSPISNFFNARMTFFLCVIKGKGKMSCKIRERIEKDNRQVQSRIDVMWLWIFRLGLAHQNHLRHLLRKNKFCILTFGSWCPLANFHNGKTLSLLEWYSQKWNGSYRFLDFCDVMRLSIFYAGKTNG
jgi:hypothetical protein